MDSSSALHAHIHVLALSGWVLLVLLLSLLLAGPCWPVARLQLTAAQQQEQQQLWQPLALVLLATADTAESRSSSRRYKC